MTVSAAEVERIAQLAELAVAADELPLLTAQLDRIVGFVAQLSAVEAALADPLDPAAETSLREDAVRPAGLERGPEAFAPEFTQGFFVVPRLAAMEDT